MGLAINGKVYGTNGVTYIGDNPIDCGYINADGSPKLVDTDSLGIDNFVTEGSYLTSLKKLQSFVGFKNFMKGFYDDPSQVPVLIHVPKYYLSLIVQDSYTVFAYFCFLMKYSKTDYSKDPDKKAKVDKIYSTIYNNLNNEQLKYTKLIQPPEDELDNFTFNITSRNDIDMDNAPLPVDEFFINYINNFTAEYPAGVIKPYVFYKGKLVNFWVRDYGSTYNFNNRTSIYFGSGYGVSVSYSSSNLMKVVYMKYADSDKVLAKYYYTGYDIRVTNVTDNGKTNSAHIGGWSFHNYKEIPRYNTPPKANGDYDIYSLCFLDNDNRNIAFDLNCITGKPPDTISVSDGLPYNPDIFLALDINNKYNWFYSGASNMITLPKKADFNMIGVVVGSSWGINNYSVMPDFPPALPLGNYLINSQSTGTDIANAPTKAENITHIEVRWEGKGVLDQIVYTNTLNVYYRRGWVSMGAEVQFTGTYSKWNLIT